MAKPGSDAELKAELIERTKEAREAAGLTQEQVARVLGIDQGRYKHYETRTPLPHAFVSRFCLLCRCDVTWLLTGVGRPPAPVAGPNGKPREARTASRR